MCGIAGFVQSTDGSESKSLEKMISSLIHRGPDDQGHLTLENTQKKSVSLGQSRLAIIDLTKDGHQPMSFDGFHMVFNGEVYNYKEIRDELITIGYSFQSNSDSEVVLKAFHCWKEKCVHRFIGMFAFVIYSEASNELYCFRDRTGVKPFHYYYEDDVFIFSSELKAIIKHPRTKKSISNKALRSYFDLGYIPAPETIYENTYKLKPGHFLCYKLESNKLKIESYWNVKSFYQLDKSEVSYDEAKKQAKELMISAFDYRMVSDVPVGVFLSGGYDSTIVASILKKELGYNLETFTIGFNAGNNEAPFAQQISNDLGTKHHELLCDEEKALEAIPKLLDFFDEPFADSSAVPTYLLSEFSRKRVTVALSADGGDEVYGGYQRYFNLYANLHKLEKVPAFAEKLIGGQMKNLSSLINQKSIRKHFFYSAGEALMTQPPYRLASLYKSMLFSEQIKIEKLLANTQSISYPDSFDSLEANQFGKEFPLLLDYNTYLPDDILVKVDRCTMAHSLEGREPLLDHRLIEHAATLPLEYKIGAGTGKRILKDILHEYIPEEKMNRPKTGFTIPLGHWMRNGLKELMEANFRKDELSKNPYLNSDYVSSIYEDFKKGAEHNKALIWKIFVFQQWYLKYELS